MEAESEIDAAFEPWQRQSWVRGKISNNLTERMEATHKLHQELHRPHEDLRGIHEPAFVEDYSTSYQQRRPLLKG